MVTVAAPRNTSVKFKPKSIRFIQCNEFEKKMLLKNIGNLFKIPNVMSHGRLGLPNHFDHGNISMNMLIKELIHARWWALYSLACKIIKLCDTTRSRHGFLCITLIMITRSVTIIVRNRKRNVVNIAWRRLPTFTSNILKFILKENMCFD